MDRALETGFKIAVLFTLLIWKKYQLKTEFQKKSKKSSLPVTECCIFLRLKNRIRWEVPKRNENLWFSFNGKNGEGIHYTVKSIIATTSRKRPFPVSDDEVWSRMIERKPLLECHKSSVFKSVDKAGWQIYTSWLTKKMAVIQSVRWNVVVKLMLNVVFKASTVSRARQCETLLRLASCLFG